MITCPIRYTIDPLRVDAFEEYARRWIRLVNRSGGTHHGYFLPHEGADNIAFAHFSSSMISHERTFMRPLFE